MNTSVRYFHLSAAIIAFFTAVQVAPATPTAYRFWEEGWPDGGILSGTLEIDETMTSKDLPDICYYNAVTSFEAHWSGNAISQPYDWIGPDHLVGIFFVWYVPTHQVESLGIDTAGPGIVYVDGSILVDYRNEAYGGSLYWVMSSDPVHTQAVPDGGSTLLFLGIALVCFAPFLPRQNRREPKSVEVRPRDQIPGLNNDKFRSHL